MRDKAQGALAALVFLLLASVLGCLHDDGRRCTSWASTRGFVSSRAPAHRDPVCKAWE